MIVSDGFAASAPDTVSITATNLPPVANAGPDHNVTVGNAILLDGSSDPDRLGVERAHVAGLSYGGLLALNLALERPARVRRVIAFDPGFAVLKVRRWWIVRALFATLIPSRHRVESFAAWCLPGWGDNTACFAQYLAAFEHVRRPKVAMRRLFTDEELRRLAAPCLVVMGEHETLYDPRTALARAEGLMPNVRTELIPNCGHAPPLEVPDTANRLLLDFLAEDD